MPPRTVAAAGTSRNSRYARGAAGRAGIPEAPPASAGPMAPRAEREGKCWYDTAQYDTSAPWTFAKTPRHEPIEGNSARAARFGTVSTVKTVPPTASLPLEVGML